TLLRSRIESGSYAAIIGNNRVPLALIELLRGTLADDPKARWTMAELEQWLTTRHVKPRQGPAPKRASRPFAFDGRAYLTARALSHGLGTNQQAAVTAVKSKEFDGWIQRALNDETHTNLLKLARHEGATGGKTTKPEARDAGLVACVCVALDPFA